MTTEAEARIREALEKAPTHGEWVAYRTGGRPEVSHAIPPFIAACNPTNIAALLDELDHWRSEGLEQARLLGISGTTEFRLLTEIDRLNQCLQYEQHRAERVGTHWSDCYSGGPQHYECALREIDRLNAEITMLMQEQPK